MPRGMKGGFHSASPGTRPGTPPGSPPDRLRGGAYPLRCASLGTTNHAHRYSLLHSPPPGTPPGRRRCRWTVPLFPSPPSATVPLAPRGTAKKARWGGVGGETCAEMGSTKSCSAEVRRVFEGCATTLKAQIGFTKKLFGCQNSTPLSKLLPKRTKKCGPGGEGRGWTLA